MYGSWVNSNTVHLMMRMHFAMLRHLPGTWCLGRNGYLLIWRFTLRGFHRLRLEMLAPV